MLMHIKSIQRLKKSNIFFLKAFDEFVKSRFLQVGNHLLELQINSNKSDLTEKMSTSNVELSKRELSTADFPDWQIEFLRRFESDLKLDESVVLKLTANKMIIFGPACLVDNSIISINELMNGLRRDELRVDKRLLAYFAKESNFKKLQEIVNNNEIHVILTVNDQIVYVINLDPCEKIRLAKLVERKFACRVHKIGDRKSMAMVNSKRFVDAFTRGLNLTAQETTETMVFESCNTLYFIGHTELVENCSEFLEKFIFDHKVEFF